MKKLICLLFITALLFTACNPVPTVNEDGLSNIENVTTPDTEGNLKPDQFPTSLKATVKYFDSEIKIDAPVTSFKNEVFYSYRVKGTFLPMRQGILALFPDLDENKIPVDDKGQVLNGTSFLDGDTLFNVREGNGKIVFRQQFNSEDRIDNEYAKEDAFEFNMTYEEAEKSALNAAKSIFGEGEFKVVSARRFGKHTKSNYYVFGLSKELDGVTFSSFGRRILTGKDDEGYNKYISLRGGIGLSVCIDENGISEVSWSAEAVERDLEVKLLSFNELLNKFSVNSEAYNMNNFASFENMPDGTYKKGSIKAYTIENIEMVYAKDFIDPKVPDTSKVIYVPAWKFTSYSERGRINNTVINAINGDILTTTLGA